MNKECVRSDAGDPGRTHLYLEWRVPWICITDTIHHLTSEDRLWSLTNQCGISRASIRDSVTVGQVWATPGPRDVPIRPAAYVLPKLYAIRPGKVFCDQVYGHNLVPSVFSYLKHPGDVWFELASDWLSVENHSGGHDSWNQNKAWPTAFLTSLPNWPLIG